MVKFVIAGPVNCPYFAKIEVLAQTAKKVLPDFDYRAMLINPAEWNNFVEETCKSNNWSSQVKSPLIWREPLEFGGPKLYFGGFNEFQEYVKDYYDLSVDITTCEMEALAEANTKNRVKETVVDYSATTNTIVSVIFATSPICYFFLPQLLEENVLSDNHLIDLRLYDMAKSQEINKRSLEGVVAEIENCSFVKLKSVSVADNLQDLLAGAHAVVIFPSQAIIDDLLLETDLRKVGEAISDHAGEEVKVLVVCEGVHSTDMNLINLRLALSQKLSSDCIIAVTGTVLERAKRLLAERLNMHPAQISNLLLWGFNSRNVEDFILDINFATVENCIISSIYCPSIKSHVSRLIPNDSWLNKSLPRMAVGHMNAKSNNEEDLLKNAMSMANLATKVLKMWWNGSGENKMHSVCIPSSDTYNLGYGVFFIVPVLFNKAGEFSVVDQLPLDEPVAKRIEHLHQRYTDDMVEVLCKRAEEVEKYIQDISTEPFSDEPAAYPLQLSASSTFPDVVILND